MSQSEFDIIIIIFFFFFFFFFFFYSTVTHFRAVLGVSRNLGFYDVRGSSPTPSYNLESQVLYSCCAPKFDIPFGCSRVQLDSSLAKLNFILGIKIYII